MMRGVEERPLTPAQVAEAFNVTVSTVHRWAEDGLLKSFKTPGGQRRFRRIDVEDFAPGARASS